MSKETWLKICSVLIYLFAPPLVFRLFFSFVEILFLMQSSDILVGMIVGFGTFICLFMGIIFLFNDEYILKQKQ